MTISKCSEHADVRAECHEALQRSANVVGVSASVLNRMHEALDLLAADDFDQPLGDNLLVEEGYPFEIAFRCGGGLSQLSFATEIAAHRPLADRLPFSLERLSAACDRLGLRREHLEPIRILVERRVVAAQVLWLVHAAVLCSEAFELVLKVYLGPCPTGDTSMSGSIIPEDCDDEVWNAVRRLLESYGLNEEVKSLAEIRHQLSLPARRAPQITFVGVNLERGKQPSFKIYLNPHVGCPPGRGRPVTRSGDCDDQQSE